MTVKHWRMQRDNDLFPLATEFRLIRLDSGDAKLVTDDLLVLKNLIYACEPMYPGIEKWFGEKVVPGLRRSERVAFVGFEGDKPIASAVLKRGTTSKFCHLRIQEDFQDIDLGQMFFTQMTLEARHLANEIHFTLPESLWQKKKEFFESFGFSTPSISKRQYRTGEAELHCSAPFSEVWSCALLRLPSLMAKFSPAGFSFENRLLMSVSPRYLARIMSGEKVVEIRKRFSPRLVGSRVVLYGTDPLSSIVGEATISGLSLGTPSEIWEAFAPSVGATAEEFESYTGNADQAYAIELADVMPYTYPLGVALLSHLIKAELVPPQSYCDLRLDGSTPWGLAIAAAGMLHGGVKYLRASRF